jgi:hypothetical protein
MNAMYRWRPAQSAPFPLAAEKLSSLREGGRFMGAAGRCRGGRDIYMDFWEWLGRVDAAIGVILFIWSVCVAIAVWIGGAPKAKRPSQTRSYRNERYIPAYEELSGMARIRADLAEFLIDPDQSTLKDLGGLLATIAVAAFYVSIRLDSVDTSPNLFFPIEWIRNAAIYLDVLVALLIAFLIFNYLTRIAWKFKP